MRYTFDPQKAKAELDAAGYRDTNGDGIRDFKGKPITLRLWAIASEPNEQTAGRLITGWLRQIGLRVRYDVLDTGALMDRMWNYEGKQFAPNYDLFLWGWNSELDPNYTLSVFTTSQIGSWSDTNWSNAQYDRLFAEQQATIDPARRKQIVDRMQQLMYNADAHDLPGRAVARHRLERLEVGGLGPRPGRGRCGGGDASHHRQLPRSCSPARRLSPRSRPARRDGLMVAVVIVCVGAVAVGGCAAPGCGRARTWSRKGSVLSHVAVSAVVPAKWM